MIIKVGLVLPQCNGIDSFEGGTLFQAMYLPGDIILQYLPITLIWLEFLQSSALNGVDVTTR